MNKFFRRFSVVTLLSLILTATFLTPAVAWDGPGPMCMPGQLCRPVV